MASDPLIEVRGLVKSFTLHTQGGVVLPVLDGVDLSVEGGECVVLDGPSGSGKSTLLRSLYANYKPQGGSIRVRHRGTVVDLVSASPHRVLDVRKHTIGYVSQFLRAIPRVPALDVVAEPLRMLGVPAEAAAAKAAALLDRLRVPEPMRSLAPATFSGGEQQRVNIARSFVVDYPILLLDEPTAALDAENRATVVQIIREAIARGAAVVGIFHDAEVRDSVGDRIYRLTGYTAAA